MSTSPHPSIQSGNIAQGITVLVADDHAFFRDGVCSVLSRSATFQVIGAVADGAACVDLAQKLQPQIVLMDVQMPLKGGFAATREITATCPNTSVVIFSMFEDFTMLQQAMECGARGYLLKDIDPDHLCEAIRAVARGAAIFSSGPAQRLTALLRDTNAAPHQRAFPDLSDREYEVLTLLARDLTNQEIATELSISLKTVRNHVSNVLAKLRASSRHEAGRIARQAYMGVI